MSWKLFRNVFEKDNLLEANLRKATKITNKELQLDNCKQNVPVALAIFPESTLAVLTSYFLRKKMVLKKVFQPI